MMVRAATESDIPQMMALAAESPMAAQWSPSDYARIFATGSTEYANSLGVVRTALVLESSENQLAGFIVGLLLPDENEWQIENVVIASGSQRAGLGSQLVQALMGNARSKNSRRMTLEVRSSNAPAIALYLKCGFREIGHRKNYYSNPSEDALLFGLDLSFNK